MLIVNWIRSDNNNWCKLETVNLSGVTASGVYIIWHTGAPGKVVYVGQGAISPRLIAHRSDTRIQAYKRSGALRVTWAAVPASQRDGVEGYLANKWNPLVGDAHPIAAPIAVNSPW
jgi:hypothetical protein